MRNTDGSIFVRVTWTGTANADHYEIAKSSDGTNFFSDGAAEDTLYDSVAVSPNTSYLYKVRGIQSSGTTSDYSQPDLATTMIFTDDPIQPGVTVVKAAHVMELRTAVNAVRAIAGLTATNWAETIAAGGLIKASHIADLRSALDPARSALVLSAITYTDPSLSAGDTIKAAHVTELRNGVK